MISGGSWWVAWSYVYIYIYIHCIVYKYDIYILYIYIYILYRDIDIDSSSKRKGPLKNHFHQSAPRLHLGMTWSLRVPPCHPMAKSKNSWSPECQWNDNGMFIPLKLGFLCIPRSIDPYWSILIHIDHSHLPSQGCFEHPKYQRSIGWIQR